jgi:hypothetical protein
MSNHITRGTVNASVSVSSSGNAIQDGSNSAITATVKNYTNSHPLAVINVDTNGDPTGGAAVSIAAGSDVTEGNTTDVKVLGDNSGTVNAHLRGIDTILNDSWDSTNHWQKVNVQNSTLAVTQSGSWATEVQYVEDAAAAADPTGTMLMGVRRDTLSTSEVSADGDNIAIKATNKGQLHVKLADTVTVDASGTAVPVTDNSSSLSVDWNGTQPVTGSGNATGALRVELANNGTGLVTTNPATATNWGVYIEDAAETAGGNLVMVGAVRRDTAASSSGTSGDNSTINTNARGATWVAIEDGAGGQITSFGGGTQYTEDAVSAADPVGTVPILVRKDTPGAICVD